MYAFRYLIRIYFRKIMIDFGFVIYQLLLTNIYFLLVGFKIKII